MHYRASNVGWGRKVFFKSETQINYIFFIWGMETGDTVGTQSTVEALAGER